MLLHASLMSKLFINILNIFPIEMIHFHKSCREERWVSFFFFFSTRLFLVHYGWRYLGFLKCIQKCFIAVDTVWVRTTTPTLSDLKQIFSLWLYRLSTWAELSWVVLITLMGVHRCVLGYLPHQQGSGWWLAGMPWSSSKWPPTVW